MNKIFTLASALRKNGRSMSSVSSDSNNDYSISFSELSVYIVPCLIVLASGFAGYFSASITTVLSKSSVILFLSVIISIMVLVLSFVKIINSMYLSDDLPVLITLPFKESQIAMAKVLVIAEQQYLYSACIALPFVIAYSIFSAFDLLFVISIIAVLITFPAIIMSAVGVVIILIMRFVGFIRSKNLIKIIGAVLGVGIVGSLYYIYLTNSSSSENVVMKLLNTMAAMTDTIKMYFPLSSWISDFSSTGSVVYLLLVLGALAGLLILFSLAARLLYFKAALAMQDSSTSNKRFSSDNLKNATKQNSVVRSILIRDIKLIIREPSFLFRSILMPLAISVIFSAVFAGTICMNLNNMLAGKTTSVLFAFCFSGFISFFAFSGANCAVTAVSREGNSFYLTNSLPISYRDLLVAKRNVSIAVSTVISTLPIFITLIIISAIGYIPFYAVIFAPITSTIQIFVTSEFQILTDLKNPNLIWTNQNDIRKSNPSLFVFLLVDYLFIGIVAALTIFIRIFFSFNYAGIAVCTFAMIAAVVIAYFINKHYIKKGTAYLTQI